MAKIYNSDVTKELANNAGIQQSVDKTPNELAEKIVPVIETNPELLRKITILGASSSTVTGTSTITNTALETTNRKKRVFLTGITASYAKDAVCDATGKISLWIQPKGLGSATLLFSFTIITLTAQYESISINLDKPLELEIDSTIGFGVTFAAGSLSRSCQAYGYRVESLS